MNLSRAMASPKPIKIGDREFRLSPLRLREWGELLLWVRDNYIALRVRNAVAFPIDEQRKLFSEAVTKAEALTPFSPEFIAAIEQPLGSFKMLHLSLRRQHPELTADELERLISESDYTLDDATTAMTDLNAVPSDPKAEPSAT